MGIFSAVVTCFAIATGLIKGKSKIIIGILLLLLFVLFTFEFSTEGDYYNYVSMYNQIGSDFGNALTYEPLYVLYSKLGNFLNLSFDQSRAILAFFEVCLLFFLIKHYTKYVGIVLGLFIVYPALNSAELFRWLCGMIIILFGFRYIIDGNNIKNIILYGIFVVCASLFHTACWFFLVFYLLLLKKQKVLLTFVVGIIVLFYFLIGSNTIFTLLSFLPIREFVISKYDVRVYSNLDGVVFDILKLILIFTMALVSTGIVRIKGSSIILSNKIYNPNNNALLSKIIKINIIFFILIIPMYYSSVVYRLSQVMIVLNYIALAKSYEIEKNRFILVYSLIISVVFLNLTLFYDGNQTLIPFQSHFTEGFLINLCNTIESIF